jgi:hypothetical protein
VLSAADVGNFDLEALYHALDAKRESLGLTWAGAMRQITGQTDRSIARSVATSTIRSLETKPVAEADGVLQMLRWLNRSPESFVHGHPQFGAGRFVHPPLERGQILRFDTRAIYARLDVERERRGLTWTQVAREVSPFLSASGLTRLKTGGRVAFPQIMRVAAWLRCPAADLMRASDW